MRGVRNMSSDLAGKADGGWTKGEAAEGWLDW